MPLSAEETKAQELSATVLVLQGKVNDLRTKRDADITGYQTIYNNQRASREAKFTSDVKAIREELASLEAKLLSFVSLGEE